MFTLAILLSFVICAPGHGFPYDYEPAVANLQAHKAHEPWWTPLLPIYLQPPFESSFAARPPPWEDLSSNEPISYGSELGTTREFDRLDPMIETPISATEYLNSLPPILPTASKPDLVLNTTFCWKQTLPRPFSLRKPCPAGSDIPKGFGICYPTCPPSTVGFGPACWSKCPPSLGYSCGGSCTKTGADCLSSIFTQISSVTEVVYNLAAVLAPPGEKMAIKPLKQFTNAATQSLFRSSLTRLLAPKLGDSTAAVVDQLVNSTFGGQKPDWGGIDQERINVVLQAFRRPMCPVSVPEEEEIEIDYDNLN